MPANLHMSSKHDQWPSFRPGRHAPILVGTSPSPGANDFLHARTHASTPRGVHDQQTGQPSTRHRRTVRSHDKLPRVHLMHGARVCVLSTSPPWPPGDRSRSAPTQNNDICTPIASHTRHTSSPPFYSDGFPEHGPALGFPSFAPADPESGHRRMAKGAI
jgi:hypothetical protein